MAVATDSKRSSFHTRHDIELPGRFASAINLFSAGRDSLAPLTPLSTYSSTITLTDAAGNTRAKRVTSKLGLGGDSVPH